ncbi:MAG: response regulator transcription factor [Fibrobacteria bacterium]|nr:response regulator transcription factor [Fibrobacteria bacterium]
MQDYKHIILVDDHPIVRQGLKLILEQEKSYSVDWEAEDAMGAINSIKQNKPDIAIIDISLKNISGLELIKWIQKLDFKVTVLVVSMHDEAIYAERAIKAGARGYVMKQEASETIIQALKQIEKGKTYISQSIKSRLDMDMFQKNAVTPYIGALTDRELEVFQLFGQGFKVKQIAEKLLLSPKTIETHQSNIKEKLHLDSASALTKAAIAWNMNK